MFLNPRGELIARHLARRHRQNGSLMVVDVATELAPVGHQEDDHREVPDAFVAVHEGVIHNERKGKCACLLVQRWVKGLATERHLWLDDGRLQTALVANPGRAPVGGEGPLVEVFDLWPAEVLRHERRS